MSLAMAPIFKYLAVPAALSDAALLYSQQYTAESASLGVSENFAATGSICKV